MTTVRDGHGQERQSLRFLLLYALAAAGGAVAYVPFLTILLPVRVQAMSGGDEISILAYAAFSGAIAASAANVGFGWLSDRTRTRRPWIIGGMILSGLLLVSMREIQDGRSLIALIVLWQIALNMMLAPLAAWAGDCVPDQQKGTLGGLLSFSPALGALSGALVTWPGLAGDDTRLVLVALLVFAMVLPILAFGRPRSMPQLMVYDEESRSTPRARGRKVASMWLARLLVQIAEATLFAYLLYWLQSIEEGVGDNDTATIFAVVLAVSVPLAMMTGRWSDRTARPLRPLVICAGLGSVGLLIMAFAVDLVSAIAGYVVFGLAIGVFLSLHTSQTLRILPRPETRGRDLGIFNLTNTVPSLVMPWLTLALVPIFGFDALFLLLAVLTMTACALLLVIAKG
ncbi:MAG: MFS transporter [Alphaproteobacteria bacterium]|nr:MFS transporter [Alphaproteobacteria bacterium]MBU2033347.1 MFS transporter [Alphaproteobacteria bacterium]